MNDSTLTTITTEDSSNNNITDDEVVTGKTRKGGGVKSIVSSLGMKSHHKDDDAGSCGSSDQGASLLLKFQNLALTGRRAEYSLIKASYKRIQKGKHPSEVVLISGLTGTEYACGIHSRARDTQTTWFLRVWKVYSAES